EDVTAGVIKWPMSVIRLQSKDADRIAAASSDILDKWRVYTDEDAFIFAETDGIPHNTITPIARMNGDIFEMDLVLRNNITTEEYPWGVYHPTEQYHHIKKENIGLIEVMGLAVLPARLQKEMEVLAHAIVEGKDLRTIADISKHADWVEEWKENYQISSENIMTILKGEIGNVFVKVLECSGIFKRTKQGIVAFKRFLEML
ncbi:MAG: galactose-1-phosphate uridylyltransferase, partial [Lachnospiraceae bacterium]|nr:galactose-1-phosphate uridylyltransferase [Lachnospiraceae bacterium]